MCNVSFELNKCKQIVLVDAYTDKVLEFQDGSLSSSLRHEAEKKKVKLSTKVKFGAAVSSNVRFNAD
jgi:hypothetical protein